MTVNEALRIVRERWRVVLLCLLVGLLSAGTVTSLMPREYSSSVTFYVSLQGRADTSDAAYQASQIAKERVVSYAPLLRDERVTKAVVDKLQLPVTPEELASRITVTVEPDTVVLSASVTDTSPQQAATVANALADEFVSFVQDLEQPIGPDPVPVPPGQPRRAVPVPPSQPPRAPTKMGVQTIRPASVPLAPLSPNVPFNLALGATLGLLVGVAGAFVRNARDTSARSADRLRELTGAPVLSEIALNRDAGLHPLTLGAAPDSAHVEAFRRLRTNLQFLDRPHRIVVVTSALAGEGSTITACNLALALADAGYRVLLVDLNLRRPRVGRYMELPPGPGAANVLASRAPIQHAARRIVGGLDVLPAGPVPPNSRELLASGAVERMLDDVGKQYNFVILDVPALLPVADAAAVAARADGAVLVVRYGKTSEEQVAAATSALEAVQAPVLGIALNGTPAPRHRRRSRLYPPQEHASPAAPAAAARLGGRQADAVPPDAGGPLRAPTAQKAQPQPDKSEPSAEQPSADESPEAAPTAAPAATTSAATTAGAPQDGAVNRPSPSRRR